MADRQGDKARQSSTLVTPMYLFASHLRVSRWRWWTLGRRERILARWVSGGSSRRQVLMSHNACYPYTCIRNIMVSG